MILGLVHCLIPMAAIALIGPFQNLNPRLVEGRAGARRPLLGRRMRPSPCRCRRAVA
ncbi:MAG: hypothetical protein WDO24_04985 [Pseudomonadota bacterium]